MKNSLVDLQNYLFKMIESLDNKDLKGEDLKQEIERSIAINELSKTAVTNGALMLKAADVLYGVPVSDDLPLIPKSPEDTVLLTKRKWNLPQPVYKVKQLFLNNIH